MEFASRMRKKNSLMWSAGLIMASSLNYAAANLLVIIWGFELHYYLLAVFIISLLIGALALNIQKSIIIAYSSMFGGLLIASAIYFAPYAIFAESNVRINLSATVLFSFLAKIFLVSAVLYFLGAILGCFLGEHVISQDLNRETAL